MRAVVQRVSRARVTVDGAVTGVIEAGLCVLLGVGPDDTVSDARRLSAKVADLRVFSDDAGRFNHSLLETGGACLVVSQFTLFGDVRRGRRPSFAGAAAAEPAEQLYNGFCRELEGMGVTVARGIFGARMQVELVNEGPVTLVLSTDEWETGIA
ncbi:MAG: D-aminoacyl-tRNA deacylase [Candidatus Dormibacteria bacterium]